MIYNRAYMNIDLGTKVNNLPISHNIGKKSNYLSKCGKSGIFP